MKKAAGKDAPRRPPQKKNNRFLLWLFALVISFLLGSALFGNDGLLAVIANRARLAQLKREIVEIREENKRLRAEMRSLRSDLQAIERIAREDLGLVKKGETVYEFLPPEKDGR